MIRYENDKQYLYGTCIEFPVNDVKSKTEVVSAVSALEIELSYRDSLCHRTVVNKLKRC